MTGASVTRRLLFARVAVNAVFACFGITLATWAVHLPALQHATGMSTAMLGTVLLVSGTGALVGMQVCGPLSDRIGSTRIALVAGAVMALAVMIPLSATTALWAACGAFLFGIATGSADVAMNAAAVSLERAYGRPIMSSFHAVFSLGSVLGSLLATVGFALHASTVTASGAVGLPRVVMIVAVSRWLLDTEIFTTAAREDPEDPDERTGADGVEDGGKPPLRRILLLGTLAFLLLFSEGAAMDWSSLHAQRHLGASPTGGAIAFGVFVTAMTVGRLCADRIAHRIGAVALLRRGSALAVAGIALVIFAPNLPVTLLGWLLAGLGLAGGLPQVFTAAGNVGVASGRVLARVVGMGYVALMSGPALIGWLAELISLNSALVLPMCAVAVCVLAASTVAPRK